MKIKLLIGLIPFFSFAVVQAQETPVMNTPPDQITPSPTAAALGTYGGVELKKSTGGINKNIPLFQLQQGAIPYNPSIEYYSTGVKVNDWGGRLGIGWSDNLNATIQRTVGTIPDEYSNQRLTIPVYQYFQSPATQEKYNKIISAELNENLANGTTNTFDPQYDIFSYNLFGKTGQFVIVNNSAVLLTHTEKIKIDILGTSPTYSFCLTDLNGLKYFFEDEIEYTSLGIDSYATPEIATAWFVNKITSPLNDELTFNYTTVSYASRGGFSQSLTYKGGWEASDTYMPEQEWQGLAEVTANSYGASKSHVATKKLLSITGSNFTLSFEYLSRADLVGGELLKEIVLTDKRNARISKVLFEYDTYTASTQFQNQKIGVGDDLYPWVFGDVKIRYFLKGIKIGTDLFPNKKVYSFSYASPQNLPPRFSCSQDEGGYFNGILNEWFIPRARVQDYIKTNPTIWDFPMYFTGDRKTTEAAKTGILNKIVYPTGGVDSIEYELNSYSTIIEDEYITTYSGQLYNSGTGTYTASPEEFDWIACDRAVINLNWDVYNPQTGLYEQDESGNTFTWFRIEGQGQPNKTFYVNGVARQSLQFGTGGSGPITVNFENTSQDKDIGLVFELHGQYVRVRYDLSCSLITKTPGDLPLPGLRVKQVTTKSQASPDIVKTYEYKNFQPQGNQLIFSNVTSSNSADLTHAYVKRVLTQQQYGLSCADIYYYDAYSDSRSPLNVFNGNSIAYSCVTELQGNTFTASVFDVATDQPGWAVYGDEFFLAPRENNAWNNGLELRRYYGTRNSSNYSVVKEQRMEYSVVNSVAIENCDFYKRYSSSSAPNLCSITPTYEPFTIVSYKLWNTRYYQSSFTEISYTNAGQNEITTIINYSYDVNGLLTGEVRTQPGVAYDADIVRNTCPPSGTTLIATNTIRLTAGFCVPSSATFKARIDNTREVLERTIRYPQTINTGTYTSMAGANLLNYPVEETTRFNGRVVGSKLMTYRSENGIFVPDKVYSMEFDAPLSSFSAFDGTTKDPHYGSAPETEYVAYNASGKIVKTKDRKGIYTYYVWAYNNNYPVAKIESSVNASISISVNDANLSYSGVSASVKNDITYLRGLISSYLNNLGLSSALVSIFTYKPLIGMTSRTDPNGVTSYYEYDSNGRLSVIKDDNEHILKTYQYNYVGNED